MRLRLFDPDECSVGFDMTPMIDITFQLIIFFMLSMDLSQMEIEAVHLPPASEAQEDRNPDRDRMIINITHADVACPDYLALRTCQEKTHWVIKVHGDVYTLDKLSETLTTWALGMPNSDDPEITDRPLMIRADERAPFGEIQKVMFEANKKHFWKMEIGAKQPPR